MASCPWHAGRLKSTASIVRPSPSSLRQAARGQNRQRGESVKISAVESTNVQVSPASDPVQEMYLVLAEDEGLAGRTGP